MAEGARRPRELEPQVLSTPEHFLRQVVEPCQPVVLRGLVKDWPAVRSAARGVHELKEHLLTFAAGGPVEVFWGDPQIAGKYYYTDDGQGFNFERRQTSFKDALETMVSLLDRPGSRSLYLGSVPASEHLPGFAASNPLPWLPGVGPRIWLGHAANVSSHYDALDNLACVVAGARRFTLFAPELIGKLYVGPIDHTMAGQPVSLAASSGGKNLEAYPLFAQIKDQALIAELGPGDALYLPKLWWHQVESTAPFNGLVNYWWDAFSAGPDAPYTSLLLAMITLAERPLPERQAWQAFFDHYVFRTQGHPLAHLPASQHGVLGPLKPENYGRLRARIMQLLRHGR